MAVVMMVAYTSAGDDMALSLTEKSHLQTAVTV
jgi:hypothetical protein